MILIRGAIAARGSTATYFRPLNTLALFDGAGQGGGFASSVGTKETGHFAGRRREAQIPHRSHPRPKTLVQVLDDNAHKDRLADIS